MSVVDLQAARELRQPHCQGPAVCLTCAHEWVSVRPAGIVNIECPQCRTMRGVPKGLCENDDYWVCGCGCHLFEITSGGVPACVSCGERQVGHDA